MAADRQLSVEEVIPVARFWASRRLPYTACILTVVVVAGAGGSRQKHVFLSREVVLVSEAGVLVSEAGVYRI